MEPLFSDVRIALRRLVREPLFATIAVLTLAIGIGANSAIFTLVNGVLLAPLPFAAEERLVYVHAVFDGQPEHIMSSGIFRALEQHASAFEGVTAFRTTAATFSGAAEPERIEGGSISADYFDIVGIHPLRGRTFRAGENQEGADAVVLLSEGLWRERFGADEEMIGRTIELDGRMREVVGVMPASASFPPEWRFWTPLVYTAAFNDPRNVYGFSMHVIARLKPGVTVAQASSDAARVSEIAEAEADLINPTFTVGVEPVRNYYIGDSRTPLLVLLGAVGLVLLIACANLANLLLAQSASRATDFAVRRALGASSGRLLSQLAAESLVLALVGGTAGLLLGMWGADVLIALLPPDLPRMPGMAVDATVLGFTLLLSLGAALLFGAAPALQARRTALAASLREGGRGLATRAGARTRGALVLAETALAFALVIGAGLLIRSFERLQSVDPGFHADRALSFQLSLPRLRYDTDERLVVFWDQLTERLRAVPGVEAVGAIQDLPLGGNGTIITFEVAGRPPVDISEREALDVRIVTAGYFDALGVPLRRGRLFDERDRAGSPAVALLSETAVARHFPTEDPIGKRIILGWHRDGQPVQGEVVGVVGDVRHGQLRQTASPEIYFVQAQVPRPSMSVIVRTAAAPAASARAVKDAVHEVDASLAVAQLSPMTDVVARSVARDRFMTRLLTGFSAVALLLAAIGIFGVISYGVAQRRREIGVRIAVGASRRDVMRLIVSGAIRLAAGGVVLGLLGAIGLTRLIRSLLFGVGPNDPLTFLGGGVVLLAVALLASMVPAWSAARTPPASVLNTE